MDVKSIIRDIKLYQLGIGDKPYIDLSVLDDLKLVYHRNGRDFYAKKIGCEYTIYVNKSTVNVENGTWNKIIEDLPFEFKMNDYELVAILISEYISYKYDLEITKTSTHFYDYSYWIEYHSK